MTFNKNFASRIYLLLVIAIVIWLLIDRGSEMFDLFSEARPLPLIGLTVFAVLPFFANTAFWTIALRQLGEDISWGEVNEAAVKTTLTRYLPGGIWLFASRSIFLAYKAVATRSLLVFFVLEKFACYPHRRSYRFITACFFFCNSLLGWLGFSSFSNYCNDFGATHFAQGSSLVG